MQKHNNPLLLRVTAEEATKERGSEEGKRGEAAQETERIQDSQSDGTMYNCRCTFICSMEWRPDDRQRPRNKQLYNGRCEVMSSTYS
jgi:hypothetical protein